MELNYEESIRELEDIVEKLENGKLSLDESLELFENGIKLARECGAKLKNAQQKVERLIEENNEIKSEPFGQEENNESNR